MDEPSGEQRVVVDALDGGFRLTRGAEQRSVPAADLAEAVAELERDGPRWVWDTGRVYPRLLAAGVRVGRAWDLRLARAFLRRAAGVPGAALPADAWDGPGAAEHEDALPIEPVATPSAVLELGRQRDLIARSERAGALRLLVTAESAGALAAAEMRAAGLPWRRAEHERLLADLLGPRPGPGQRPVELERLLARVRQALGAPDLNPDSPAELSRALRGAGIRVESTRAHALREVDHPAIEPLLAYRRLARLHQANGWRWLDDWVRDGRFHPEYVVGGVVTGRWAARGGGALQLPKQIRGAVVADPGWCLVVADAAQLEPRVLAGLARDETMAAAGRDRDLYDGVVASGAVADRATAKVAVLAALYGGTGGAAGRMVPRLAARFPRAIALVEAAARTGERGGDVFTLLGRGSPEPDERFRRAVRDAAEADEVSARRAGAVQRDRGRFLRNFVVQGTAAEWALCWLAGLRTRLWALGEGAPAERPHLVYFLHDEVLVHAPVALGPAVEQAVRLAAADAGRLLFGAFPVDFPLDVRTVERYSEAA